MKYILLSIFLILLSFSKVDLYLRLPFEFVLNPIQFGFVSIGKEVKNISSFFTNISKVREENLELLKQKALLEANLVNYADIQSENSLLREQLNVKLDNLENREYLIANVIGNSSDRTKSSVIIDKGEIDGVTEGMNIILGKHLIGFVSKVYLARSVVSLITSPNMTATVLTLNSGTEGILSGEFGTSVVMTRILPDENIEIGDLIVTSGADGKFERNLIVGSVSRIDEDPSKTFRNAQLDILVNLNLLNKVFVLSDIK